VSHSLADRFTGATSRLSYRELGIGIRLGVPDDDGIGATFTNDFGVKS
jgi:hypothetical protein